MNKKIVSVQNKEALNECSDYSEEKSSVVSIDAILAECGDVAGEFYHPAFQELSRCKRDNIFAFEPAAEEYLLYPVTLVDAKNFSMHT